MVTRGCSWLRGDPTQPPPPHAPTPFAGPPMWRVPSAPPHPPRAPGGRDTWKIAIVVVVVVLLTVGMVIGAIVSVLPRGPTDGVILEEEGPLRIGTVLSITGSLAAFGTKNRQGVILAIEEINAAGGVLGQPVELYHQDDNTRPDTARAAAGTLISQDNVSAIIGATGSGQCGAVLEVARVTGVFEVSGSCTSPRFSNPAVSGGWFARTAPSDALQGVVAASYALQNLSFVRAAVIGINNPYGVATSQTFADSFVRFGGTMVADPRIVPELIPGNPMPDYTTDLIAVLNTNPAPQVLYIVAYPPEGIQLIKNFEAAKGANPGWASIQLMFSEGVFDQTGFLDILRNPPNNFDITNYLGTAPSAYGGLTGPRYPSWSSAYSTRWGGPPGLFDDNNYDAAYLIALAAQKAGSATGAAIKANIAAVANPPGVRIFPGMWQEALVSLSQGSDIDYEGVSGSMNIDPFGDPPSGYIVWGVDGNGQWDIREVFPEALVVGLLPPPPSPAPGLPGRVPGRRPSRKIDK